MTKKAKKKRISGIEIIAYLVVTLAALCCIVPFLYIISVSLTAQEVYVPFEFRLFPKKLSLENYAYVLKNDAFVTALLNTVFITLVGTFLCISVTFTYAYALTKKDMPGYKFMISMVIASMLFNPGIVSQFLTVKGFGLLNSRWALIIPVLSSYYYVILAKTSIAGIPADLEEAARIDGANDLTIFFRIILPLSKAVLATLVLFLAVYHWNVYFNSVVYINDSKLRTLQVYVKTLIIDNAVDSIDVEKVPSELIRYATVVLAMLPIVVVYPFLQKHFVKGVMVGSVKG
ncbi:MAG: carbohydrate ABC transporter permease [Eubacteriales bacterium]|nr:carbohydrate ABC transporter permease [Eubacteriales bacterium]